MTTACSAPGPASSSASTAYPPAAWSATVSDRLQGPFPAGHAPDGGASAASPVLVEASLSSSGMNSPGAPTKEAKSRSARANHAETHVAMAVPIFKCHFATPF
ncbi:hypothetical protein TARUN_1145 [Trichoderma arundinaceum]|uniref:Uncharacterized protein n=1 Tax=Trichoderma arundinaceum TaxID=490622 RepID=A0A395NY81_TRIAR|nr:hypothetical protein TARUN_1145 [Trichoderma arundinaceum]